MPLNPPLGERERVVLRSVVRTYVDTAVPVPSERVARDTDLGCSPATIRATMGRLEGRGLMMQPHTSAGRVPTDRGYRAFIDDLPEPAELDREDQEMVYHGVDRMVPRPDRMPISVSKLLGDLSGQMGFASPLHLDEAVFGKLHAQVVGGIRIAMVLTLEPGLVRSSFCEPGKPVDGGTLARGVSALNRLYGGQSVGQVRQHLFGAGWEGRIAPDPVSRIFRTAAEELLESDRDGQLSVSGLGSLLLQPEFRKPTELDSLALVLKERGAITGRLGPELTDGEAECWIGGENEREELHRFGMVAGRYRFGRFSGVMGVIGPTRMKYDRAMVLVDFTRKVIDSRIGSDLDEQPPE